ncbi:MAG: type II/IV secretion system protein [Bacteroidetes bacterium]|nr:type II/IV secretion system protein [Bacteroidota bacterium]
MSIRGSLQNIRDQIGKINTILDGSKSREQEDFDDAGYSTGGDRPPVSHSQAGDGDRSAIESLYQVNTSEEPYQDPDMFDHSRQAVPDQLHPSGESGDGFAIPHEDIGPGEAELPAYVMHEPDGADDALFATAFPHADDHEAIDPMMEPAALSEEAGFEDEFGVAGVDASFGAEGEAMGTAYTDASAYAEEYTGGSMIDETAIDEDVPAHDYDRPVRPQNGSDDETMTPIVGRDGVRISDRVVQRLLKRGLVTEKQVLESWDEWANLKEEGYNLSLWRVLTLHPDLKREVIFEEAALVYAFERATISRSDAIAFIERAVPVFEGEKLDRMLDLFVIPVAKEKDARTGDVKWLFVTHDPTRPEAHKLLRELGIKRVELKYWPESTIEDVITAGVLTKNVYLDRLNEDPMVYDLGTNFDKEKDELVNEEELENEINRSSLINLFEATLVEAVNRGASDIHIFPNPSAQIEIHFRIDGHLELWHREERISAEAFLAVVKDKSQNVDRFEKDTAQDGFIQRPISDTTIRFRVSILPIASHKPGAVAESIVIRVLDDRKVLADLRKVGMLENAMKRFKQAIHQPHGMVILTGPTGSGKSTTLVAALHQVINPKVNVLTIEDPVEYLIKGVRQVKLSHHLSMEGALRALLRHDPDVVMVGEMRDRETAELAIKLANTGHLTFSTLHTNDAPSAVSRLFKMGIEPFLIAYAINIVVAQRLIRTLCSSCKVIGEKKPELMAILGFSPEDIESCTLYDAGHDPECERCGGTGYKGRRAVAETLYFSEAVRRQIILSGEVIDEKALRDIASGEGMLSLQQSAIEIAKEGDTSLEEVIRITGE